MGKMNAGMYSTGNSIWETPQDLFDKLNEEFHFTLDVCATEKNHKCERYFTPEQDGLSQNWGASLLVQSSVWIRNF